MVKPIISNSVTAMPMHYAYIVCECSVQCAWNAEFKNLQSAQTMSLGVFFFPPLRENVYVNVCPRVPLCPNRWTNEFHVSCMWCTNIGYFIKLFTFNENENCNYGSVWFTFKKLFFELALFSTGNTNSTHFHSFHSFVFTIWSLLYENPFLC